MNYLKSYNSLINRAKQRKLDCYFEKHHIIPKCMGGSNDKSNIVELTPEEHFVAHQLLVKIYPTERKLIHAAVMMTVSSSTHVRNNKLYGWLRRNLSVAQSTNQTGNRNSQSGTCWVYDSNSDISKKIKKDDLDYYLSIGWYKGRNLKKNTCSSCGRLFFDLRIDRRSCNKVCEKAVRSASYNLQSTSRKVIDDDGRIFESLSSAARYHDINVETIRYRISIGRYTGI